MKQRVAGLWLGVCLASFSLIAGNKGGLKGIVQDADKNPLEGVTVTIVSQEFPSVIQRLKTNKKGEFVQIGLDPGLFKVTCGKEGFTPHQQAVKVSISEIKEITIRLDREVRETVVEVPGKKELNSARGHYQAGRYEEALKAYQGALEKMPGETSVLYNIGVTYMALGKTDEAIEVFLTLTKIQPEHSPALKNLGQLYGKKRNFEQSAACYALALKYAPEDAEAWYNLGVSQVNNSRPQEAQEAFQKSITAKADYADSYYQLGLLYLHQNNRGKGREALEKFLTLAPGDSRIPLVKKILEDIKISKRPSAVG